MAKLKHPIREAERYLQNARELLSVKAEKDGDFYTDNKYVKMAGNTAWNGVLVALDAVLDVRKNMKKGQRLDFKDYQMSIVRKDNKMNQHLINAYELLHKSLGYDGVTSYRTVQDAMNLASVLIGWADKNYVADTQDVLTGKSSGSFFRSLKFW
ncbi:MAG: DUF5618 family protein [Dysgonamonadaceae bacterium]|jgi:hypothetical protein|nr:DUF5618 family protein [Dysgonamonadaceae bacterium]